MKDLCLIVNSVAKNSDVWEMFFDKIEQHTPPDLFNQKYLFVDECGDNCPDDYEVKLFDKSKMYREQFWSCVRQVPEKYCVYISEDYILYDDVRGSLIEGYIDTLENNPDLSFVRFVKGGVVSLDYPNYKSHSDLYQLYNFFPYFYTNQAAVWKTRALELIHEQGPNLHIANADYENSFEYQASQTCERLGINGVFCYYGEPKRGMYHYDSSVFPHICTALVKGKWNLKEYEAELQPLLEKYNIDVTQRGVF